ncbi:MAG TPA: toprim domain-containing protein [Thermodesulfovibrionales bacterium]|nr:toprim domain-containing protein [Thermodesulfovibrionales bacterium]
MIKAHSREPHKDRRPVKISSRGPSAGDLDRASRLREVMEALYEANKKVPVIVEGKRDSLALRNLGLVGEIITLHRGNSLYEFCEEISERFGNVILLLDWDDKGETLHKTLSRNLRGLWEEFSGFREILKILCQKDIKDIEGIPKLLKNLEGDETHRY